MIPKEAVEKSIEGGWKYKVPHGFSEQGFKRFIGIGGDDVCFNYEHKPKIKGWSGMSHTKGFRIPMSTIALDPLFWQALGKALGLRPARFVYDAEGEETKEVDMDSRHFDETWVGKATEFYHLILTGGDTKKFWEELLTPTP